MRIESLIKTSIVRWCNEDELPSPHFTVDPIPNPKRFLCVRLGALWIAFDLGAPGIGSGQKAPTAGKV